MEAFGEEGDVLLGISTSGKARSVIEAFKTGGRKGIRTILFTGELEEDAEIVKYTDLIFKVHRRTRQGSRKCTYLRDISCVKKLREAL